MKLTFLLAALSVAHAGDVARPELAEIKTVYLLPMSNSLDQFLAIRLTKGRRAASGDGSETGGMRF